jgi:3-isopropylmalate/(R)-2-methylmalate dehydratase small subunit
MSLRSIRSVQGRAVVVSGDDIDTDRIIPARYLRCVTFDGLGEALFYDERFTEAGDPKRHPLNEVRAEGATILVSGSNFGCGSSREHAPQSIARAGFEAVVAESFAEIFFGNSTTLGLVCAAVSAADLARLLTLDVAAKELRAGEEVLPVRIPESAHEALIDGFWDPLGELLEGADAVRAAAARLGHDVAAA